MQTQAHEQKALRACQHRAYASVPSGQHQQLTTVVALVYIQTHLPAYLQRCSQCWEARVARLLPNGRGVVLHLKIVAHIFPRAECLGSHPCFFKRRQRPMSDVGGPVVVASLRGR